jgi:hypothetical protein
MQRMHQPITNDMIHFIPSRDCIGSSILTSLALHRCFGLSAPSHHSTCLSHLQPVHQAKPFLDLLHLGHMTQCHVLYATCSFITCVSFATSLSHFHLYGICCLHTCICRLITTYLTLNTISPPRLSLDYQNQTKTFHHGAPRPWWLKGRDGRLEGGE